jgi:hypothetical protein
MSRYAWCVVALLVFAAGAEAETRYGLWDPGFQAAVVRTPYVDPRDGTKERPLTVDACLWRESITGCPRGPSTYRQAHFFEQNAKNCRLRGTCDGSAYWIFHVNNEPAFHPCNPGPPNTSLPRAVPGHGLAGFSAKREKRERFHRAHLVLDLVYANPCDGGYGIPFLGIAIDRDRGNRGSAPAALNRSAAHVPDHVEFTARLRQVAIPRCDPKICDGPDYFERTGRGTVDFAFWAVAEWGGMRRMLFLDLVHFNRQYAGGHAGSIYEWNWPVREDFLASGADLAFLEAEDLPALCGFGVPPLDRRPWRDVAYRIDLDRLFRCASDLGLFREPVPESPDLPVTTLGWKVEGFGTSGGIWATVHGMRTYAGPTPRTVGRTRPTAPRVAGR